MHVQLTALKHDFKTSTIWGWISTSCYLYNVLFNASIEQQLTILLSFT